jgi:S-adenosylmethionine/arginine decarboxylase-like enzyme
MFRPLHQQLIVKAKVTSPLTTVQEGQDFLMEVVRAAKMVAVTEPQVVYVNEPGNEGLTGSVNLATSHTAFHVWDRTGLLMFDLYSCCAFEEFDILKVLDEYMLLENGLYHVLDREDMNIKRKGTIFAGNFS